MRLFVIILLAGLRPLKMIDGFINDEQITAEFFPQLQTGHSPQMDGCIRTSFELAHDIKRTLQTRQETSTRPMVV